MMTTYSGALALTFLRGACAALGLRGVGLGLLLGSTGLNLPVAVTITLGEDLDALTVAPKVLSNPCKRV